MSAFVDAYVVDQRLYVPHRKVGFLPSTAAGGLRRPCIRIGIPERRLWAKLRLLFMHPETVLVQIDTGADTTAMNRDTAAKFGVNLDNYKAEEVEVVTLADGSVCVAVRRQMDLVICNWVLEDVPVLFPLRGDQAVVELMRLRPDPFKRAGLPLSPRELRANVLGIEGVLDKVLLCLDSENVYLFRRR